MIPKQIHFFSMGKIEAFVFQLWADMGQKLTKAEGSGLEAALKALMILLWPSLWRVRKAILFPNARELEEK